MTFYGTLELIESVAKNESSTLELIDLMVGLMCGVSVQGTNYPRALKNTYVFLTCTKMAKNAQFVCLVT